QGAHAGRRAVRRRHQHVLGADEGDLDEVRVFVLAQRQQQPGHGELALVGAEMAGDLERLVVVDRRDVDCKRLLDLFLLGLAGVAQVDPVRLAQGRGRWLAVALAQVAVLDLVDFEHSSALPRVLIPRGTTQSSIFGCAQTQRPGVKAGPENNNVGDCRYACAPLVVKRRPAMRSSSACSRAFSSAFSRAWSRSSSISTFFNSSKASPSMALASSSWALSSPAERLRFSRRFMAALA